MPSPAHPRSRGENAGGFADGDLCGGSSPLTRGKQTVNTITAARARLIPAHAGKTPPTSCRHRETGAHPRSRGENRSTMTARRRKDGSSPLTRGKHLGGREMKRGVRLIPAHAGKTVSVAEVIRPIGAHPRSRGENFAHAAWSAGTTGSSPLTRGKRDRPRRRRECERLIPAHAGKTRWGRARRCGPGAHPRSRGENQVQVLKAHFGDGSSPLTRGKHGPARRVPRRRRLIPAHAGKTTTSLSEVSGARAHPRSRGENPHHDFPLGSARGSSPLTRGKQGPGLRLHER